jgi:hypothetical protein
MRKRKNLEKEIKARREAAEKIKQRQEKYTQEIAAKREKEAAALDEDKKKKEALKKMAREYVMQIFKEVANQPGLKELQEKEIKQESSDDEVQEE